MINTLFCRIKALLEKDVSSEGESNDLSVLLRYLMLFFFFYYMILTFVLLHESFYNPAGLSCVMLLVMTVLFCLSYRSTQRQIYIPFLCFILLSSILFTLYLGKHYGFSLIAFIGIPLLYYDAKSEIRTKNLGALGYSAVILVSTLFSLSQTLTIVLPISVLSANLVLFALCLSTISYFFCQKFIQAEHKLYQYNKKLKQMASLDPLTGLMNRRCMNDMLKDMIQEYNTGGKELSVAIGDIDFFKRFNDNYGHDCGDYVLKSLSELFLKFMDGKGEVCRWGGEEFLFVFTSDNADNIFVALNDLRHMIKHSQFVFQDQTISVTMTFGLEEFSTHVGIEATIKKADEKLYLGKESGRDKVVY